MHSDHDDDALGMSRPISRRDFVGAVAVGIGAASLDAHALPALPPVDYPPARTGLRGDHVGSFEAAHALRDGVLRTDRPIDTGEQYDLVVVGGGISGLAAAHYFREQAGPRARILVLDNHDDFGGHAKRNEFTHAGRTWIGYGGTQSIDSPLPYSANAKALITALGIDVSRWERVLDGGLYRGLGMGAGTFFDAATFGTDRLVRGSARRITPEFLAASPLPVDVQAQVLRLANEPFDPMPGLTSAEKKSRLARMSYTDFITREWKLDPRVTSLFQASTHGLFGFGIDAVPAQDAFGLRLPGFQGMQLDPGNGPGQNYDAMQQPGGGDDYYFHFPDGNASIARLLVRALIPRAVPGRTADDIVTARIDYARLDDAASPARIRLRSTVVHVAHDGPAERASGVTLRYVCEGREYLVRASQVVLACWHHVIPHICPELPAAQLEALRAARKVPLVYTNVFVRQWTAFHRLRVNSISAPGMWHGTTNLDFPVSIGRYAHTRAPEQPIVVHMTRAACKPGLPGPEQHKVGRAELLSTSFREIERSIRDQLSRMLGAGGFDPARDILGITVNRWPHGYAYQYSSLADPFWRDGQEPPCVAARQPFGRIAIANSDAAAYAYTDAAIDQARRAVSELLAR